MSYLAPQLLDTDPTTQRFVAIGNRPLVIEDWLTPPPDEEGGLEKVHVTVVPEARRLGRKALRLVSGDFTGRLSAPGKSLRAPNGLTFTRVPEGLIIDDSGSPLDLLSVPRQRQAEPQPTPSLPMMSELPDFKDEYSWLSQPTSREELLDRSLTHEDFVRNSKRPVIYKSDDTTH